MKHVSLALTSACALTMTLSSCYWLAKYDDLSSGPGDAGTNADGPSVPEAGLDSAPFCPADAGALAYCMAFDGIDAVSLGLQINAANVAIVSGTYLSPPSSLLVEPQGAASFGRYDVTFPLQPTTARLEFQMQTTDLEEGVTTLAISLLQASTQTTRTLNVVVVPNGGFQVQEYFALGDGGIETSAHQTFQVDGGARLGWHHVVLTLTANDANKQYLSGLTVDDQVLEEGQPLTLAWAAGTVTLNIGVTFAAAGGPQFFFDNVRADFAM